MNNFQKVNVWEEEVIIPTYLVGTPDKNPLFLEKRVYQGSSGKVYPHPVTDKILDVKVDKTYKALFLENDFLKIMILPELGGRVQRAFDKKKNYDFVYYNRVIKPALVGLAGPWISGGIEFNWPQHHRPSTFDPVNYTYRENSDGSATIVCSEIENMFHTSAQIEFTLYPDKAYLELNNRLFNRTDVKQTFLWWANPAVAVNSNYKSIFPPDVTAVMDHGKRAVSTFPIATGTYYKVDYSKGVDISKYDNLPVPTSYMAAKSNFDFVGGYDEGVNAGILHVADHHVSPGKKQWTWGCGEFGQAWDRNLTDEDGPYFELMTGCFTDNQPDFSYIAPMETRDFTQYFMPYHELGTVHNACKDLSMRLDVDSNITANLYCSGHLGKCEISFYGKESLLHTETISLTCCDNLAVKIKNDGFRFEDIKISIKKENTEILSFCGNFEKHDIPSPATAAPEPKDCATNEDLYLYGLHIEQYRHATRRAEDYYLEGLQRDPSDVRLNNAYGLLLLKKCYIKESENYFRKAVEKQTRSNPNPINGDSYYNLGLSLFYQDKLEQAYDCFYKAIWNFETQSNSYLFLSLILCRQGKWKNALEFIDKSLLSNPYNTRALNVKTMLLRALKENFNDNIKLTLKIDCINLIALYLQGTSIEKYLTSPTLLIDLSLEFANAGFYKDAIGLLELDKTKYPLVSYYKAYYAYKLNEEFKQYLDEGFSYSPDYCFPNRIEDVKILNFVIKSNPLDFKAPYYLGNLLYDKERHNDAINCFEKSIELGCNFPTPYRNLSLLNYNVLGNKEKALSLLETAFDMDKTDARILYELDLLRKKLGISSLDRKKYLDKNLDVVFSRDDLYLEYITLLNLTNEEEVALSHILSHKFHPWEGGEGKVPEQYLYSNVALAIKKPKNAVEYLSATFTYPQSLGEGKLFGAQENRQNYYLGCAFEKLGESKKAIDCFNKASIGISVPESATYYNDQPPETIFYQGLALIKLNQEKEANLRFQNLVAFADTHWNDHVKIDYFAVSLPDLLVFNEDLDRKNRLHCMFMKALGFYGLGKKNESKLLFEEALSIDPNAFQISTHYKLLFD